MGIKRVAEVLRETRETSIKATLNLDGQGRMEGGTPVEFFNHMLAQTIRHGLMDLDLSAEGDTQVDCHHTVEDTGIVLGMLIMKALGSKEGIRRYGHAIVPMDDALVLCAVDLSGRPYLCFDLSFTTAKLGEMDTETVEEFFRAVSVNGGVNLHFKLLHGQNNHHIAEAAFKAFGVALRDAVALDERVKGAPSTKGTLT